MNPVKAAKKVKAAVEIFEMGKQIAGAVADMANQVADSVQGDGKRTWQDERADTIAFLKQLGESGTQIRLSTICAKLEAGEQVGKAQR